MFSTSSTFARLGILGGCVLALACAPYTTGDIGQDDDGSNTGLTSGSATSSESAEGEATGADDTYESSDSADTTGDTGSFSQLDIGDSCGAECDIWNPDACPEGEKCTAVACTEGGSYDFNKCRPIVGEVAPGDECTPGSGWDDCAQGSICFHVDEDTGLGTCVAFCSGSPEVPECTEGTSCAISHDGVLPLCYAECDPLTQDCVMEADSCLPSPNVDEYVCFDDASADMAPYGSLCGEFNECNAGLLCLEASAVPEAGCDASNCCSPMCSISAALPCPGAGQNCEPVFVTPPAGYEDVGVCTLLP